MNMDINQNNLNQENNTNIINNQQIPNNLNNMQQSFNNQQDFGQVTPSNNKAPKNNVPIIVGIIGAILIVSLGIFIATKFLFNQTNENNNESSNNSSNENNNESSTTKSSWDEYELVIDGASIKLPITYKEFINKGFYQEETYHSTTRDVEVASYEMEPKQHLSTANSRMGDETFTNGTTNNISLLIYNPEDTAKSVSESYVVGIALEVDRDFGDISVGQFKIKNNTKNTEIVMNKSTSDDIEKLFGDKFYIHRTGIENEYTYMPDSNNDDVIDVYDLNAYKSIHLYCDTDTQILEPYDFNYTNFGSLEPK